MAVVPISNGFGRDFQLTVELPRLPRANLDTLHALCRYSQATQDAVGLLPMSSELLTDSERVVLHRISVFRGAFTVHSAVALASGGSLGETAVFGSLMSLTRKSLVTADLTRRVRCYRLPHATRALARRRLTESGDGAEILQRHAQHHLTLLRHAEAHWQAINLAEWVASYGYLVDDVRAALDWALSSAGDAALGVALTLAAIPFALQLARLDEFRGSIDLALERLQTGSMTHPDAEILLKSARAMLARDARATDAAL